jgi:hypothetical protein
MFEVIELLYTPMMGTVQRRKAVIGGENEY